MKKEKDVMNTFLNDLSKMLVLYMHDNNMPITSIFSTDVLGTVPRCHDIYKILIWDYKDKTGTEKLYSSLHYIIPNMYNGVNNPCQFFFNYEAIKNKLLKNYILYNITWRKTDV